MPIRDAGRRPALQCGRLLGGQRRRGDHAAPPAQLATERARSVPRAARRVETGSRSRRGRRQVRRGDAAPAVGRRERGAAAGGEGRPSG